MGSKTTTSRVLSALEFLFEEYGTPTIIVNPRITQFTSKRFVKRMEDWNIKHVVQKKDHPCSNRFGEDGAKFIKSGLLKMNATSLSLHRDVHNILIKSNSHQRAETNLTPLKLMERNVSKISPQFFSSETFQKYEGTSETPCWNLK